jgi:hypothetical protein
VPARPGRRTGRPARQLGGPPAGLPLFAELMTQVGGGDPAAVSAIYGKIDDKGAEAATRGALGAGVWTYLKLAFAVGFTMPPA